jgi:hypothetical protein
MQKIAKSYFQLTAKGNLKYSIPLSSSEEALESETIGMDETFHCGFRVRNRNPEWEYTVVIGDEPLDVASSIVDEDCIVGTDLSEDVVWPDSWHFESCVGVVFVNLLARTAEPMGNWQKIAQLRVNVLPSKLGWERYDELLRDLKKVSAALIFDLVSKNKRNVGFKGSGISSDPTNVQLRRIERIWAELVGILARVAESPATALVRTHVETPAGQGLDVKSVVHALGRGIPPIPGISRVRSWRAAETTKIYEHALIKAVLQLLVTRLKECEYRARSQAQQLRADLPLWLDPTKAPEIIATEYMPRIERLEEVARSAVKLVRMVNVVLRQPIFDQVSAATDIVFSPVFQHVLTYNACFISILQYLRTTLWTLDEGLQERVKRTSRLFEHWVFIQLAAAITNLGFECVQHEGLYSIRSSNRFTLDLDKGTLLTFSLSGGRVLRLRYEPWIFSKKAAVAVHDGVYAPIQYAWNPDVVLEVCSGYLRDGTPKVDYAVVVDAKYTTRIVDHHWNRVTKYWKIRATHSDRQVAMQLWLVIPSPESAKPTDECVQWGAKGDPAEHIDGTVGFLPATQSSSPAEVTVSANALQFVTDLCTFIGEAIPSKT